MSGRSPDAKVSSQDFVGNPTKMMEADFRQGYKAKVRREYDMFLDQEGVRSVFHAYRAVFGGMIVCHEIRSEYDPDRNVRMIVWYFRRSKSTPVPLVVWAGNARMEFPKGSLDPAMIEMSPTERQRKLMVRQPWQPVRPKRIFNPATLTQGSKQ